jgi:hypothetical protein
MAGMNPQFWGALTPAILALLAALTAHYRINQRPKQPPKS